MEWMTPDMLKLLVCAVATAGGTYGGIRADLRRAMDLGKSAHERLDRHLEGHL